MQVIMLERSAFKGSTPTIIISEQNQNLYWKERFLLNPNNNNNNSKKLILLLSTSFKADSQDVFVCKVDDNTKTASISTALELTK